MYLTILIILIIITGFLSAYTIRFQETTIELSREFHKKEPNSTLPFQDLITPKSQTIRNIFTILLFIAILILGMFLFKWYYAALITITTFFPLSSILKVFIPKAKSLHFKAKISKHLEKRLKYFEDKNQAMGIHTLKYVINIIRSI